MIETIPNLYNKYREIILYGVFGVITTIVNFLVFLAASKLLGEEWFLLNNALAWIAGVVVAFVSNKLYVFNSKTWSPKIAVKEFFEFVVARLLSFGFEELGMWFFISILQLGEKSLSVFTLTISGQIIVKFFLSVVVVILNYFFSKFIIFKNNKK